jgi:hypothetical protein
LVVPSGIVVEGDPEHRVQAEIVIRQSSMAGAWRQDKLEQRGCNTPTVINERGSARSLVDLEASLQRLDWGNHGTLWHGGVLRLAVEVLLGIEVLAWVRHLTARARARTL